MWQRVSVGPHELGMVFYLVNAVKSMLKDSESYVTFCCTGKIIELMSPLPW